MSMTQWTPACAGALDFPFLALLGENRRLVERLVYIQQVGGSSPSTPTKIKIIRQLADYFLPFNRSWPQADPMSVPRSRRMRVWIPFFIKTSWKR